MGKIEQFEDLPIWKQAAALALDIYRIAEEGKLRHDFSMKDQIKRAAISISSNIAEGYEYGNNKEFVRFLRYAKGSAGELRSQLYILFQTELIEANEYEVLKNQLIEISRQLSGFMRYLREHKQL
jgi:four helix bundle protein